MWFSKSKSKAAASPPFFTWSNQDHGLGVTVFDLEHQRLARLISDLHQTTGQTRDHTQALRLMEALIRETRVHFDHEERAMEAAGFPGLEPHAAEHSALLQQAQDLVKSYQAGSVSVLALPVLLKNWLIPHIQTMDRAYAITLKRQGVR